MALKGGVDYESDRLTSEYLHFHYAARSDFFPWGEAGVQFLSYAQRVVSERFPKLATGRGLDVGCAVGRSAFEMARSCREVVGIDYSRRFIERAKALQNSGACRYHMAFQGEMAREFVAEVPEGIDRKRVDFLVGDAHALPTDIGVFDWVLGANLICRLRSPRDFLAQLPDLVVKGGILVLNSPFTWMEEHTQFDEWLGGRSTGPRSEEVLKEILDPNFELIDETSMPFMIRETERKYQLTFAHSGKWRRR
ncbi:MAG: putative 4-mercaptohistidine N1-methyltransferase [Verrucomicrobiota bacterium]